MAFLFVALLNAAGVSLGVRLARTRNAQSLAPARPAAKLLLVVCLPLGLLGVFNAFLNDELHEFVDRYLLLASSALPILVACIVLHRARAGTPASPTHSEQPAPPP